MINSTPDEAYLLGVPVALVAACGPGAVRAGCMRAMADIPRAGDCNREFLFLGGLRLRFRPGFCIYEDKIRFLVH